MVPERAKFSTAQSRNSTGPSQSARTRSYVANRDSKISLSGH